MSRSERQVLEDAVRVTAEQAADSGRIVDEALAAGLAVDDPIVVHVKMLRLELLNVKADLEREPERLVLDCSKCGQRVHWVSGLGVTPDTGRTGSPHRITSPRSDTSSLLLPDR